MNTRLLKETFLIDEKAVRSTGQLGKVGRELLCCLISAGNSNAGILTIKQVSTISHASPYLSSKISRLLYHFLEVIFTYRKHQHYFQTRLASALSMDCRHKKLSSFTAKFYSCESTSHTSGQLPQPRWLKWQEWQCQLHSISGSVVPGNHWGMWEQTSHS